jgi:hypothetical protein
MKRALLFLGLVSLVALPARATTVDLAPPYTGSSTAEGCSMDGRNLPFVGTCIVQHEAAVSTGRLDAGVEMSGPAAGTIPSVGRGESLAKLTIVDTIAPGAVPSYAATFTVLGAAGSRVGPPVGAVGDRTVLALLRVVDPRPRCAGQIHGSDPGQLVSASGELPVGTNFTLRVDTPPACIRTQYSADLTIEVSLFVRVALSDRGVFPGGAAGYEVPGFGTVSASGSATVALSRTT